MKMKRFREVLATLTMAVLAISFLAIVSVASTPSKNQVAPVVKSEVIVADAIPIVSVASVDYEYITLNLDLVVALNTTMNSVDASN